MLWMCYVYECWSILHSNQPLGKQGGFCSWSPKTAVVKLLKSAHYFFVCNVTVTWALKGNWLYHNICDTFFIFLWITLTKAHRHHYRSPLCIMRATRDLGLMLSDRFWHACRGLRASNTTVVYSLASMNFSWQSICYSLMWNLNCCCHKRGLPEGIPELIAHLCGTQHAACRVSFISGHFYTRDKWTECS